MKKFLSDTLKLIKQNKLFTGVLVAAVVLEFLIYPQFKKTSFEIDIDVLRIGLIGLLFYLAAFRKQNHQTALASLTTTLVPLLGLAAIALYIVNPLEADRLAREDNIVENLSAIALFIGSLMMLVISLPLFKKKHVLLAVSSLLIAGLFFVIGAEEISWGQRIFNIESSEFFLENNWQNETNLHNLSTYNSEYIYYFGGFFLLVFMPFFHRSVTKFLKWIKLPSLKVFIPSLWFVVPFAIMAGFIKGADYSRALPLMIALAGSLVLVTHQLVEHAKKKQVFFTLVAALSLAVTALAFMFFYKFDFAGHKVRSWGPTEYRELIIAIGLMVYSFDTVLKPKGLLAQLKAKKR